MADEIIVETVSTEVIEVGVPGPQGATGANGTNGTNGQGVPVGGTTGQVLRKASGTNYDTEWAAAGSGSGSVTSVSLAGTGLSISGSPITTSGTITANVSYGTTAGTATQGNDSRIANILKSGTADGAKIGGLGGSINLAGGSALAAISADGGASGSIDLRGGSGVLPAAGDPVIAAGSNAGNGGSIILRGADVTSDYLAGNSGSINLSALSQANGGSIDLRSLAAGTNGGSISAVAYVHGGGSINMDGSPDGTFDDDLSGGSITTKDGGGSINTTGTGSIGFGTVGTRTTLTGTATADRAISLPNAGGTLALTQQAADYEVTDETKGVIMKSPNGTRWRVTIDNNGSLLRTAIALLLSAFLVCGAKAQVRDLVYGTDNVVIGPTNTNALSFTNRVSLPISSGAATTNSILTADGAGGSAFVVSRTVTRFTTNDQTKTNWANNFNTQATNNDPQMGSWALDANSFYRVEYAVAWVATTNSGLNHALGFSTNLSEFNHRTGVGQAANITVTAITTATNVAVISLPSGTAAGTGGRFAVGGFIYLLTSSNSNTMTYRWYPISNSADATTLIRSSMVSVTKMAP